MKKRKNLVWAFIMLMMTAVGFVSCDFDDDIKCPEGAEDMVGFYYGKMKIERPQGDTIINTTLEVGEYFVIRPMPVHLLMDSVLTIDPKSELYKELGNIIYYTDYTVGKSESGKKKVNLLESPSALRMMIDKNTYIVKLAFKPDGDCYYLEKDGTLTVNLVLEEVKVDDKKAERFVPIRFQLEKFRNYNK